jgi:hypothetical protein
MSFAGSAHRSLSSCVRTLELASRIRGRRVGRRTLTGWGRGKSTGLEMKEVVRCASESRRWVSDLEESKETWWVNWASDEGAVM